MKKRLNGILTLLLVFVVQLTFAQERPITGQVVDEEGMPLPGVNIVLKGSATGTQTDFDGNYNINATPQDILVFSFVGYSRQEVIVGGRTNINVTLLVDAAALDEVIVIGYGRQTRELSTSAVSTVSAEQIENFVPSTSIDNILQGQAAGVQVTAANGRPGQTAFVQIRGVGSIRADTTPLYVVDGQPVDDSFMNNINPNDIASMSILKDAATVSRYGSRGANGVILITTKSGKKGESNITFRSSVGTGSMIDDPFDLMNASQKLQLEREYAALGVGPALALPGAVSSPEQLALLESFDTDWKEELLRDSFIQSNSLSISGGEERLSYFLSLGYDKNTGIIDRIDGFERISSRLNTSYQAKDWVNIDANIAVSRSTTDLPRDRNNVQNPFRAMYDLNPYDPLFRRDAQGNIVREEDGTPVFNTTRAGFPIARALTTEPEDTRNFLIIGSLAADIDITKTISNRFQVGATNNRLNRTSRSLAGGVLNSIVGDSRFPGTQTDNFSIDFEYNVSNLLNYSDTFNELHNVSASLLVEYNENIFTNGSFSSRGFPSPGIPFQAVAAEATNASSAESRNILFSQGAFLDYNYDSKYILSGSIRRDGSSRFGPDNKYGYFYSASAAWNIANENFMQDTAFDVLKLRASYGTSGNQNISNFAFLDLLNFGTYNGFTAAIPAGVGNPAIQWESQKILDIGVEFGLFNNRLNGVVDYFKKNSEDLLLNRPISFTVGDQANSIISNIGEIENSGIEVSLNFDAIRSRDFIWSLGGNVVFLDNKVVSLVDGEDIIRGNTILRVGEEINTFRLVRYAGVDPANGQPLFLDDQGNVTNTHSASFATVLDGKSPAADFEGGFYSYFKYKGFGLRGDFVFKGGNYINNFQKSAGLSIGGIGSNRRVEAFNYWKQPGDQNVLPSPVFQSTADLGSDRFLEKGDYVRLRTLTLDYRLPSKFMTFGINSLRVYATGQNLITWTDYSGDPEIGIGSGETSAPGNPNFIPGEFALFSYPQTKSYTFGIEIGF